LWRSQLLSLLAIATQPVAQAPQAELPAVLAPPAPAGQLVVRATQARQQVVPTPQREVVITNSHKTNKLSPDSVCEAPRTHNDEVNAIQSPGFNDNQLPSKKVYISKHPRRNKKGIGCKRKKSYFNNKTALGTLSLPNRAHHFQVYSDAVASADDIAINRTPLVISPK
jgi:hypothetical protein